MPPRSGQLDEISQAIGALQASFESCERYIHQRVHDDKEVSSKIDGLGHQITKEAARMKAEFQVQLDAMDRRVGVLEKTSAGDSRTRSIISVVVQSPLIGWVVGVLAFMWAMATHGAQK